MTETDDFQIIYLPVGEKSKGGDAIAIRFGNLKGPRHEQKVIIIDGGTKDSGKSLVEHVMNVFETPNVDAVLVTHTDVDHVSGLTEVLNDLNVTELWMLEPWDVEGSILSVLNAADEPGASPSYLKKHLGPAYELVKIARAKNIPIKHPYEGSSAYNGIIKVLGPNIDYYKELIPQFRASDKKSAPALATLFNGMYEMGKDAANKVVEDMFNKETLQDGNEHFSAENNSSVITLLTVGDKKILFTGDADADAINRAADYAENTLGISLSDLHIFDVPHHGSKQNVGPALLNRVRAKKAVISAPKESKKHPHQSVINAFHRRDTKIMGTLGTSLLLHSGVPHPRFSAKADVLPFVAEFED